eukprot:CAMPEP_0115497244 /NCGR_PEP_ID=MMETSP0271-20121206/66186_1 /TAXON_ID=71861 /ORGANISM="Scrippsiella trochoidea, Strain CCMP3099" /LENGTH=793 /DNA_ID=CAMNT_0002925949 /DNA_START=39 /DNA_END=2421 /DNA_ORIENTATION=+
MTHDWEDLESGSSDSSMDSASTDEGRQTRYRNLALALGIAEQNAEQNEQDKEPQPHHHAFGNKFQAATGFLIFVAVNLRLWDSAYACLTLAGYGLGVPCHLVENKFTTWFCLFVALDLLFIVFQIACVYRDRHLAMMRRRLHKAGAHHKLFALHVYSIVVLGIFSGWQILRSIRQINNPEYRDSFLTELDDPSMVSRDASRMPLYSSHLTFLFELPFVCRVVHCFFRDSLAICDITYFLAWFACFQLVVIAVVTYDYSVSSYIREQYSSSSAGRFICVHVLYRSCECLARSLTIGAIMLHIVVLHFPTTAMVVLAADLLITVMTLGFASRSISKRVLFLSLPFFGSNLALFADEGGIARTSYRVTRVLDITRSVEFLLAVACSFQEVRYKGLSQDMVDETYQCRVMMGLMLLLFSGAVCFVLRGFSVIQVAKAGAVVRCADAMNLKSKQSSEKVDQIFGLALNESYHYQNIEHAGFASILFSRGIGDQFASLLEILWETDDIRLSRLQIVGRLGEGGFGKVVKVQDTRSSREFAVKLQRRDRVATAAVREAEFLHEIHHPFIVRLEKVFRTSAFYGILLELCDCDLNRLILERERPQGVAEGLPAEEAKHLASCMVVALEHLHSRRIVFRDLKPENVLTLTSCCCGPGGRDAKLADFGLAKFVGAAVEQCDSELAQSALCHFTTGVGTLAFMCTEDWYALGCCLMLMLLGERGSRIARSPHGGVLLPPPPGEVHGALRENARHLEGGGRALALLLSLTVDSAAERIGAQEIRESLFMQQAMRQVDLWLQGRGA